MSDLERTIQAMVDAAVAKAVAELRRELVNAPTYVKAKEYAARHSIALSTVREAISDGRLPAMRIGRAVRVEAVAPIAPRARPNAAARRQERVARLARKHGGR
jgi:excisionase family DNA binding protein